jgi:hypothetical protein
MQNVAPKNISGASRDPVRLFQSGLRVASPSLSDGTQTAIPEGVPRFLNAIRVFPLAFVSQA